MIRTLAISLAFAGCTPYALSPPARSLPLESVATLEEGQVSVQAAGGYHDALDVEAGSAALRARVGIVPQVEAQLEGQYLWIDYDDERSPHLGAGRLGVKIAALDWLAVVAGVGGGGHTHGAFAAPDVGLIFAYENPYVVPWGAVRGFASLPIDPSTVRVTRTNDGELEEFFLVPPNTAGWQLSTGVRIPVVLQRDPARPTRGARIDFLIGGGFTQLHGLDGQNRLGLWQVESGIELVIDPSF